MNSSFVLIVPVLVASFTGGSQDSSRLAAFLEAYAKRCTQVRSFQVVLEGEKIVPKGAYNHLPEAARSGSHVPSQDLRLPFKSTITCVPHLRYARKENRQSLFNIGTLVPETIDSTHYFDATDHYCVREDERLKETIKYNVNRTTQLIEQPEFPAVWAAGFLYFGSLSYSGGELPPTQGTWDVWDTDPAQPTQFKCTLSLNWFCLVEVSPAPKWEIRRARHFVNGQLTGQYTVEPWSGAEDGCSYPPAWTYTSSRDGKLATELRYRVAGFVVNQNYSPEFFSHSPDPARRLTIVNATGESVIAPTSNWWWLWLVLSLATIFVLAYHVKRVLRHRVVT